jgi:hypothetical protein
MGSGQDKLAGDQCGTTVHLPLPEQRRQPGQLVDIGQLTANDPVVSSSYATHWERKNPFINQI